MEVVPALPLRDGRLMARDQGEWRPAASPYPDGGHEVVDLARHLFARFGNVAVLDLGAGRTDDPHHNLYQKLAKQHVALWVDAVPESLEDVMDLFVSGVTRVTIRPDALGTDELRDVLEIAEGEVWLAYAFHDESDLKRQLRTTDPGPLVGHGATGALLVDLGRIGTRRGFDARLIDHVPDNVPVAVAGGVAAPAELDSLRGAGAAAVLAGTALLADLDGFKAAAERLRAPGEGPEATTGGASFEFAPPSRSFLPGVLPSRPQIPRLRREDDSP